MFQAEDDEAVALCFLDGLETDELVVVVDHLVDDPARVEVADGVVEDVGPDKVLVSKHVSF